MEKHRILVGTDFSEEANIAAKQALHIARQTRSEVVLVHAGTIPDLSDPDNELPEPARRMRKVLVEQMQRCHRRIVRQRSALRGQGPRVSQMLVDALPDQGLCTASKELNADLLVIGTHNRSGVARFFRGSVAERCVRRCKTNVLVARERPATGGYRKLLVATDLSDTTEDLVSTAIGLAVQGASIDIVHFWQLPALAGSYYAPAKSRDALLDPLKESIVRQINSKARELIEPFQGTNRCTIRFEACGGSTAVEIERRAADYDLVIMGGHGRTGLRRFVAGSIAETTVRHCPTSVLVVHNDKLARAST